MESRVAFPGQAGRRALAEMGVGVQQGFARACASMDQGSCFAATMTCMGKLHCLVVGAGAFGISTAIELAIRGHDVTVLDPGPLPRPDAASTDISKVIRMDYGKDVFYTELMEQALDLWQRYNQTWGSTLFHEHGFCVLSSTPLEPGTFEGDSFELLQVRGHTLERLDAKRIAERFPMWKSGRYVDGYFNPRGGWAESGRVVTALVQRARELGVSVCEGARVQGFIETDARTGGVVLHTGEQVLAEVVIVAAGAWTPVLLPELGAMITPVGQPVLHFQPADPTAFAPPRMGPWAADIQKSGWYGFAANARGVVKIANHGPGVLMDPRGARAMPGDAEPRFRAFLRDSLPALADAPIVHRRVCLYCDTQDGDFLIDHHPDRPGLVVAAGGSGHAFKFTPVLGAIIADVAEHVPNPWRGRFAWRTAPHRTEDARCKS